jgi:glutamate/tyrosine decarboxylase-like PLP-dependent enzyme
MALALSTCRTCRSSRYELGEKSVSKDAAYQIIHDELLLDSSPRLNLASFVTTWMEPECDKLILEGINKNYADMDEYPVTTELQASVERIRTFLCSCIARSTS